jgi:stearoyl-CoA desaturase (Delta-9 desaturase)
LPNVETYTSTAPSSYADPINVGEVEDDERPDWIGGSAFIGVHLACLLAFVTGVSWAAIAMMVFTYTIRMFGITGVFHRYFSHRTYKTSRIFQFVLAWLGTSSAQQGPLWWAAHHRHHHRHSDTEEDIHSPIQRGFLWSHVGWIVCKKYEKTNFKAIPDFAKYPELCFLNNFHILPPIAFALAVYGVGALLGHYAPSLHTNGFQMLVWGFFVSTTLLYHCTFCINSLAHVLGSRRFDTKDHSRNNFFLAILTLGEGWHNNHHRCPYSERQGIYWWEIDISHYILRGLAWLGLVWDLQKPPQSIYLEAEKKSLPEAA